MTPGSKFVDADCIRLHYLEWPGDGPTALLLHGRGLCAQVWTPTAEALSSRFRVLAMDLRGHGDSDKPEGRYEWKDVAPDLKGFIHALDLSNVFMVAHSRGAVLAALGGAMVADRIAGAVIIEPGIPGPNLSSDASDYRQRSTRIASSRRAVWPSRDQIFERYSGADAFKRWREDILWSYIEGGTFVREDGQVELKCTPAIEAQFTSAVASQDMIDGLSRIDFPVLHITSDNPGRFPDASAGLRVIRDSAPSFEHLVMPDAGHFIPQEKPEELEREIWRFVESDVMAPRIQKSARAG